MVNVGTVKYLAHDGEQFQLDLRMRGIDDAKRRDQTKSNDAGSKNRGEGQIRSVCNSADGI